MITAATSKYTSAPSTRRSAATDQPHAASVPIETSVSIVAAPCRAFTSAARWKSKPAQKTTGVASANASHSQPSNCSGRGHREHDERAGKRGCDDEPAPDRVGAVDGLAASAAGAAR